MLATVAVTVYTHDLARGVLTGVKRSVRIDLSHAHLWDITAVNALDKVVLKFRRKGCEVEVLGLNQASATLVDKFGVHDKDTADNILKGH